MAPSYHLPRLRPQDPFPLPCQAWPSDSPAPGLLACGADLSEQRLLQAYARGIFPWFSPDQPILWFSTNPRMVLRPSGFLLHRDLRKKLTRLLRHDRLRICFDGNFVETMQHCAQAPRSGQSGTWIGDAMIEAYARLHRSGFAQSVSAWVDDELVGGLYLVTLGQMVFGESMFTLRPDGSKLALAALVAWARHHQLPMIDCQQDTAHLRSLGGHILDRSDFINELQSLIELKQPEWGFSPRFWSHLWPDNQ